MDERNFIVPEASHGIVNRVKNSWFSCQGWPTVCRDEAGTLYAVSSSFRMEHCCPFGKTAMYISKNGGKTWTPPIVINDTYMDDRDAGIVYLGNGKMLVSWFCHPYEAYEKLGVGIKEFDHHKDGTMPAVKGMMDTNALLADEHKLGGSYVRMSDDYGVTWSEPVKVSVTAPHGPIRLSDKSILYFGKEMPDSGETVDTSGNKAHIQAIKSNDGGYTWEKLADLKIPVGTTVDNFWEPHAVELPDGRILAAIRAQGKEVPFEFTIYTTVSADGGKTWSEFKCMNICGSPPHLLLHSSGAIICSYGRRTDPYGEHAIVSYDLGESWTDDYVLNDNFIEGIIDNDMGYPSSTELDDGSIMSVYYQKVDDDPSPSVLWTNWKLKRG